MTPDTLHLTPNYSTPHPSLRDSGNRCRLLGQEPRPQLPSTWRPEDRLRWPATVPSSSKPYKDRLEDK